MEPHREVAACRASAARSSTRRPRPRTGTSRAEKAGTIAPQRKLANEKPKGETVDYDTLIKSWPATPPKKG